MSRSRARRILGMTVPQWTVLGILGLCICSTLAGGYWWLSSMVTAAYEAPIFNFTPPPPPTPLPSETPLPTPSPTPVTYESQIPAGWKRFTSDKAPGMEVWLPPSYEPLTEGLVQDKNMHNVQIIDTKSFQDLSGILSIVDLAPSPYTLYTTFGLSKQPLPAADLDKTITLVFGELIQNGHLMERQTMEIWGRPAQKLVFDITGNGVNAGAVVYVVQENMTVWYLGFVTPYNELYTRMTDFDQTANTFRVINP